MKEIDRQIKALEFALDYVPGGDDNHSHSVLQDMLHDLRQQRLMEGQAIEA
jgi:hypothetical protein